MKNSDLKSRLLSYHIWQICLARYWHISVAMVPSAVGGSGGGGSSSRRDLTKNISSKYGHHPSSTSRDGQRINAKYRIDGQVKGFDDVIEVSY